MNNLKCKVNIYKNNYEFNTFTQEKIIIDNEEYECIVGETSNFLKVNVIIDNRNISILIKK